MPDPIPCGEVADSSFGEFIEAKSEQAARPLSDHEQMLLAVMRMCEQPAEAAA